MIRQEQRDDRTDAVIRIIFAVIQAVIPERVARAYFSITPCVFIGIVHFEQIFVRLFEKVHLMMLKRVNELFGYLVALLRSEAVVRGRPAFLQICECEIHRKYHCGGGYDCRDAGAVDSVVGEFLARSGGIRYSIDDNYGGSSYEQICQDNFRYVQRAYRLIERDALERCAVIVVERYLESKARHFAGEVAGHDIVEPVFERELCDIRAVI